MAQPPGSMPPGRHTPDPTRTERDFVRRVQGALFDGHVGRETTLEYKKWPVEKETITRRGRNYTIWRDQKTKRFASKPTMKQMANWNHMVWT